MRVVFLNINKKKIDQLQEGIKYVLITDDPKNIENYSYLKIKPIVIMYNGAYVIDLEQNNVIINKYINQKSVEKVVNYSNTHQVKMAIYKKNDNVFEIKLMSDNYHRRIIIPYMFKDIIPDVKSIVDGKTIYITDKNVSLISAIEEVLNYLNITNNYIDLENIYVNVSNDGYYKEDLNWKGYIYET